MEQNDISISLYPNELDVKKLKSRERDILAVICALLNHPDGGKLFLDSKDGKEFKSVSLFVRGLEQKVMEIFGPRAVSRFSLFSKTSLQLVFGVSSQPFYTDWFSVTSNLYLPLGCQVLRASLAAELEAIREILNETRQPNGSLPPANPHNWSFVEGQSLPNLEECKEVQFKLLKSEKVGRTSLAKRIFNNKFASYVSAFANYHGGRIFYGINDDGVVKGEIFDSETKLTQDELTNEIAKKIASPPMIWPKKCERGEHWDIHFEEVIGGDGRVVPSTFVIIISVAPCPGGVYTKEPESYVLVEGNVTKMGLEAWKDEFNASKVSAVLGSCAGKVERMELEDCRFNASKVSVNDTVLDYKPFNLSEETTLIAQRFAKLRQTGDMAALSLLVQYYENEAEELRRLVQSEKAAYENEATENNHVEQAKHPNNDSTQLCFEGPNFSPQIPPPQIPVACKKNWRASDENSNFSPIRRTGLRNLNPDPMQYNALPAENTFLTSSVLK